MGGGARSSILEVLNAVKTSEGAKAPERFWFDYAKISRQEAERIFRATGIKIDEDYVHAFIGNSAAHVLREHGVGREKREDQQPVTGADFELVPEIIATADEIVAGVRKTSVGNETVVYLKKMPDGDVLVVEEVRRRRKKLAFYTMRKAKAGYTYDLASPGHSVVKK